MRLSLPAQLSTAVILTVGLAGLARAQDSQGAQPQQSRPVQGTPAGEKTGTITVVGCLMAESDYRRLHGLGKGALGGAGLGDEFVLVGTANGPAAGGPMPGNASSTKSPRPSATSNPCQEQGTGPAYRLTGHREEELKGFAGKHMEITGSFKHEDGTARAEDTSKLPAEIDMTSYREVALASPSTPAMPSAVAPEAPPETPAPAAAPAPAPPVDTSQALPHTASSAPLVALIGALSLSAGSALWYMPRRRRL